ncbi:hypothetical protein ADICYQ_3468 [Cyclobacterium qasimii M12-11B]|uniref:Uncharacterized protein n=3 Tax=Cyclobacterium qasimii TaxID=1350429 RepID=S7WL40_9BACT|nr:hypothetical protein ADICYQ_3468 [Cyclobacterium qasimii M12-11B]GEO21802.1 hypothetical protein CQA01_23360 [Cyclobacterium qasimii]
MACNGSSNLSSEQLESFESKLTATNFYWQSRYGSYIDFQFRPDGKVYALINGKASTKLYGNWAFDNNSGELQIAWEGGRQYTSIVKHIDANWGKITFESKIHEYGDKTITRLKLLDDRFSKLE